MLLLISSTLFSGCGLSFCRENRCCSYAEPEASASKPVKKETVKEKPSPEPEVKPQATPIPKDIPELKPIATPTVVIESEDKPITLGATTFKYNAYDFTDTAKANLDVLADYLIKHPNSKITVEGHTDSRGAMATNKTLSEQRAKAVTDYLLSKGIDAKRMKHVGYGETKPKASNKTAKGRAQNRRIEIVFDKK